MHVYVYVCVYVHVCVCVCVRACAFVHVCVGGWGQVATAALKWHTVPLSVHTAHVMLQFCLQLRHLKVDDDIIINHSVFKSILLMLQVCLFLFKSILLMLHVYFHRLDITVLVDWA